MKLLVSRPVTSTSTLFSFKAARVRIRMDVGSSLAVRDVVGTLVVGAGAGAGVAVVAELVDGEVEGGESEEMMADIATMVERW